MGNYLMGCKTIILKKQYQNGYLELSNHVRAKAILQGFVFGLRKTQTLYLLPLNELYRFQLILSLASIKYQINAQMNYQYLNQQKKRCFINSYKKYQNNQIMIYFPLFILNSNFIISYIFLILSIDLGQMFGSKQQKKQRFTCKFFQQGSCKNGKQCKFYHPINSTNKNNNENMPIQNRANNTVLNPSKSANEEKVIQKLQNMNISKKYTLDEYYAKMSDSMKIKCYSCGSNQLPVYLSCGCSSICQKCAKAAKKCSIMSHKYDPKIYIK